MLHHVKEQKRRHSKQLQSVLIKKKGSATALGSRRGPEGVVAEIQEQLPAPRRSIEDEGGSDPLHSSNSGSGGLGSLYSYGIEASFQLRLIIFCFFEHYYTPPSSSMTGKMLP